MGNIYRLGDDGVFESKNSVQHRNKEYPENCFSTLGQMQQNHFWYRGRHRYLLHALDKFRPTSDDSLSAVDLGGGVGGWVNYLAGRRAGQYLPLALADSSRTALRMAGGMLPDSVDRYHIDLMNLGWRDEWDVAFMLDVIEHLHDDREALSQAKAALKPGGLLFVTTPAFKQFWSYNDELALHLRRYTRSDFVRLAKQVGLQLCDARYFMFLLSPLYWLSRQGKGIQGMTDEEKFVLLQRTHQVPSPILNLPLTAIFAAETPLGHWLQFPWGTSLLGVFRK